MWVKQESEFQYERPFCLLLYFNQKMILTHVMDGGLGNEKSFTVRHEFLFIVLTRVCTRSHYLDET